MLVAVLYKGRPNHYAKLFYTTQFTIAVKIYQTFHFILDISGIFSKIKLLLQPVPTVRSGYTDSEIQFRHAYILALHKANESVEL